MLIDGKQIMSLSNDELGAALQHIALEMERRKLPTFFGSYILGIKLAASRLRAWGEGYYENAH